ncbi:MAG: TIGR03667 family PPOX class F420-dependent oxidoreductase [Ktedonobacteraceae bacterium]
MLDLTQPGHAHVDERLRSDIMLWLNTVRPDGRPHSAAVWFLWDGSQFLIFSQPNKQKIRNLQHNPNVVLALDNTKNGSDVIVIEGKAELLKPGDVNTTLPAYAEKYLPELKDMGWTPESMAADYSQPIRVTPTKFVGL